MEIFSVDDIREENGIMENKIENQALIEQTRPNPWVKKIQEVQLFLNVATYFFENDIAPWSKETWKSAKRVEFSR